MNSYSVWTRNAPNTRNIQKAQSTQSYRHQYHNDAFPPPCSLAVDSWRTDAWRKRQVFAIQRKRQKRERIKAIALLVALFTLFISAAFTPLFGAHVFVSAFLPDVASSLVGDRGADAVLTFEVDDIMSAQGNELASLAESSLQGNPYGFNETHGLCLAFVDDVFAFSGQEFRRTYCAARAMELSEPISYDCSSMPIGACVFSTKSITHTLCKTCGKDAGHVSIYLGGNQLIHNGLDGIEIIDINDFIEQWGPNGSGGVVCWGFHMGQPF